VLPPRAEATVFPAETPRWSPCCTSELPYGRAFPGAVRRSAIVIGAVIDDDVWDVRDDGSRLEHARLWVLEERWHSELRREIDDRLDERVRPFQVPRCLRVGPRSRVMAADRASPDEIGMNRQLPWREVANVHAQCTLRRRVDVNADDLPPPCFEGSAHASRARVELEEDWHLFLMVDMNVHRYCRALRGQVIAVVVLVLAAMPAPVPDGPREDVLVYHRNHQPGADAE
jgi:hypothetical protein